MIIKISGCSLIMYYYFEIIPQIRFKMVIPMNRLDRDFDYVEMAIIIKRLNKGYVFTDIYMNKYGRQTLINEDIERVETDDKRW